MAAGEVDTLPKLWAAGGMPVKYAIPSPVVLGQFGATVLARAPHPSAARLLAGWLTSKEGKAAREKGNFEVDYRPGSDHPDAQKIYASGVAVIEDRVEEMEARAALYKKAADILTGQAK
jgi:ABC-type Fe3+ transport system substrate-binding protein